MFSDVLSNLSHVNMICQVKFKVISSALDQIWINHVKMMERLDVSGHSSEVEMTFDR